MPMRFAQLSHALSLNDICDCPHFHKGYLAQIRCCVPPSRNGLAHANATRDAALAEELFWTVLADIKKKYPGFISNNLRNPGLPWRFKRAIHVVDSTNIRKHLGFYLSKHTSGAGYPARRLFLVTFRLCRSCRMGLPDCRFLRHVPRHTSHSPIGRKWSFSQRFPFHSSSLRRGNSLR